MEKTKFSQLELFSDRLQEYKPKSEIPESSRGYVGSFEKIILVIIGFIITGVIAFCLGVERGKIVAGPGINAQFDYAQKPLSINPAKTTTEARDDPNTLPVKPEVTPQLEGGAGGYTVQVASYQRRTYAEKETAKLKKKGFSTLILSKGKYVVVCVGNFLDKERARSLQTELRPKYRDCCIRRL